MNLQVNLILESELRSASAFNAKAVMRVLLVVAPAAALLGIALFVINFFQIKFELDRLQTEWAIAQPRKAEADTLRNQVSSNQDLLRQLKGIAASHLAWHQQLEGLMRITPPDIQLRKLTASQTLQKVAETPSRDFNLTLEGKASGTDADQSVATLKHRLLHAPAYTSIVETATVASYGLDTSGDASRDDRAFRIDCEYVPRKFQ